MVKIHPTSIWISMFGGDYALFQSYYIVVRSLCSYQVPTFSALRGIQNPYTEAYNFMETSFCTHYESDPL